MPKLLERVVVLGAGTMGARLAAHCANHGLEVTLLDVTRERAEAGLRAALASRPPSFFLPHLANRIRLGSFHGDLQSASQADWVVEAIIEDLAAKQSLLANVASHLGHSTILSTNTSGLPVHAVGAELPAEIQTRWLGTHFFNPPRYMYLVELIAGPRTTPEALEWIQGAIETRLGKGVVRARDTPNFIANRIGLFALLNTLRLREAFALSVEDVDALTGPLLGWPKSATFRTLDIIGVDTLVQVVKNSRESLSEDGHKDLYQLPDYIAAMVDRAWLGDKTGQGFYKRTGDAIWALDPDTMTYHPRRAIALPYDDLPSAAQGSRFVQQTVGDLFAYCHARLGEISDDREAVNRAMRWGYNWQRGPFEMEALLADATPQRQGRPAEQANDGCLVVDLGDGIGGFEFRTKLNVIGADAVRVITEALGDERPRFDAWVISNAAEHFSAGADLLYLLALIHNEEWEEVDNAVRQFQTMTAAVKFSPRPVVTAPFGLTLGGGCELMLHATRTVAHAELYAGLVEVGVGLIPAGGGTKEMTLRADPRTAFETIAKARTSSSALEARELGYLRPGDQTVANRARLLEAAKQAARQLADAGFEPPWPASFSAPGPSLASTLELGAYLMREAEQISAHDFLIARKLIHVICAGGAPAGMPIAEDRLLDLERESFLSLCGEPLTQARIAHMLKTGKALRN